MARLIDADALIKDVCDLRCGCMPDKCEYDYKGDKYCDMAQYIEATPTVLHETDLDETKQRILKMWSDVIDRKG